jgi:metal-responsive CopG/Arc/MetJ family transcriptional regulator
MGDNSDPIIRKTVSLPASLWARIDEYQLRHRIKRDTAAVRRLIQDALDQADRDDPKREKPAR